ncbi:putative Ig domain-containing protein [Moraxella sp. ZY210820]|uniref:putative Ig domain-containing protein n=1 Tax=unclassified Moraxella TaxID=2685852 RepID=UPI00272F38C7|nr:putative Ig domain-containing protein [Moraxella sp. ZY210820]WLF84795.1 AHH domain-containing protein [Moraxella sp. ZY210820]
MLGFQVHHIFPEAMMKDLQKRYTSFFKDIGLDFNDYSNRINLFDNDRMANIMKEFHTKNPDGMNIARFFGSVRHSGGHDVYNKFVEKRLNDILSLKQPDGKTPINDEIKKALVLDLHQQLVVAMREGFPPLHDTNANDYKSHFSDRLAKPQDFMDKDGNYDPNTAHSKRVESYKTDYDKFNIANVDNNKSIVQDFNVIKQLLIEKYGSLDNLPNPPYLEQTKNELKSAQYLNDLNQIFYIGKNDKGKDITGNDATLGKMRSLIATLVYDEAKASHFIVTKEDIDLFKKTNDMNIKANIASAIFNAPKKINVDTEVIKEAEVYAKIYQAIHQVATVTSKFVDFDNASEEVKQQITSFKNGQGGYITPEFLEFMFPVKKSYNVIESYAKQLMNNTTLSAKFNGMAGMMDFVNGVYDGLIEGLTTNNWDKFFAQAKEYGTEAVIGTAIGMAAIAAFGAMVAAGGAIAVVGTVGATVLVGAGLAAWGYMWYELTTKVRETDWEKVYDGFMSNILEIDKLKDWFAEQTSSTINGLADVLNQFTDWGEQGSLQPLLLAYKDTIEQSKGAIDFKYIKTQIEKDNQLAGTEEDDTLSAKTSKKGVVAYGDKGADSIIGSQYQDILLGGEGNDRLYGEQGNDILNGNEGNDNLYGEQANDTLIGGLGNDTLNGGEGNDTLIDESGNETYDFIGDFGHDTIYDKDGQGVIKINYQSLSAGKKLQDDIWQSSHSDYIIRVVKTQENVEGYYSLHITSKSDKSKSITIPQWKQGDLGLNLVGLGKKAEQPASTGYTLGTDGNNIIDGVSHVAAYAGNDFIITTVNDDVVIAGAGNDVITTGAGDDVVYAGVDTGSTDDDVVFAGEGSDKIYTGAGDDIIFSSSDLNGYFRYMIDDLKTEEQQKADDEANIPRYQRAYSNIFFKEIVYDTQLYTSHSTSYYFRNSYHLLPIVSSYYLATAAHNRRVDFFSDVYALTNRGEGYAGADTVYGGAGHDVVVGSSDTDSLYGEQGNDSLYGLHGDDILDGGDGDDSLIGGDGLDILNGSSGNDYIIGGLDHDKLYGGTGDDMLNGDLSLLRDIDDYPTGTPFERFGDDILDGGAGNDQLWGDGGNDTLYGGEGDDKLQGDSSDLDGQYHGDDTLDGGKGNDTLIGNGGNDTLYGGDGDDKLKGDSSDLDGQYHGNDTLNGGAGNDQLWGDGGNDTLYGGEGDDQLEGDYIHLDGQYHGNDSLDGGKGDDILLGYGGHDTLYGGEGDDELQGDYKDLDAQYHGDDTLNGGAGNDKLLGQGGNDTLYGGEGDDKLQGDYIDLDGQYHGDDRLDGGTGDDIIVGQGGNDTLYGGEGDDELQGDYGDLDEQYHGDDTLNGGAGNDKLLGQGGNDTLHGGEGDDVLSDGTGDDWVYGDTGNDYFYVGSGEDHLHGGEGHDFYILKETELKDGKTKHIVDSDGRGQILIDGRNIFASDWRVSFAENKNGTIHMKWKDSRQNYLEYVNNKLMMSSDNFSSKIIIEGFNIQVKDGQGNLVNTGFTTAQPIVLPMGFLPNGDNTSSTQTRPSKPNNDGLLNLLNQQSNPLITFTSNGDNEPFSAYIGPGLQQLNPYHLLSLLSNNQNLNHWWNNHLSNQSKPSNSNEPFAHLPLGQSVGVISWEVILSNLLPNLVRNQAGEFTHQYQIQRYDPLVLDLNQDGHIGTIAENKHHGVMFDQDADGIATATAWLSPEDGFLVRDLNQDGLINHGKELFGDQTQLKNGMIAQHGFEALADLDSNQDGIINADDDAFLELKVWRDLNLNGQTEQGELFSLSEVGISDIDVQIKTTQEITTTGGILREQGTYTTLTGEKRLIADIHFNQNVIYSQHKNTLNSTYQGLNIKGYGRLDELADVKSTHAELATLIESFEKNNSFDFIFNHSDQLMKLWSMTDQQYNNNDIDVINTHNIRWQESDDATHTVRLRPSEIVPNNMQAEHYQTHTQKLSAEDKAQVKFVDAITGIRPTTYVNQATTNQLQQFKTVYQQLKTGIEGELINQTILKPYFKAIKYYQIAHLQYHQFDKVNDLLINNYEQNASKTSLELLNLLGINAPYFSQYNTTKLYKLMSQWYSQHKSSIDEYLKNHQTVVNTKFIDDTISDYALTMTDRTVYLTGTGAKKVIGSERDETFISGQHDDVLMGKGGNNTYILSNMSGSDTIEFDYDSYGLDRFLFDDVDAKDVRFMSQGKNLVLQFGDHTVVLTNVLHTGAKRQFELVFNQEHYYLSDLKQMDMAVLAMDNGLYFSGWEHDDVLIGNEQDNVIYGFEGADILEGQTGQDRLYGGTGYDTYRFDANAGHDEIYEDWLSKEGNHLQFNLAQNQLQQLYYQQDDLIFIYGDHNKLVLKNVVQADLHLLDISFIDRPKQSLNALLAERAYILGTDNTDVITHYYAVSNNNIYAQSGDDEVQGKENVHNMLDGGAGDDTLTGGALKDTLIGGMGHDTLFGRAGDDTLQGDDGNDWLEGGAGADTLIGGQGDDTYMADSSDRIIEQADGGYDRLHISASYDLQGTNIEELILLGSDNLTAYGSEHNDTLIGNTGNNHLDGRAGIDTLIGGLGDDYYVLDDGQDVIVERWGEGIDTLEQWTDRHFSYHVDEQGRLVGSDSYAMLPHHVENLILKGHAKTAFGNELDNTITLNTQNNFVNALSGNDTIIYQKGGGKDTIMSTDDIMFQDTLVIDGYDTSEVQFVRLKNNASQYDMLQIRFKGNTQDSITLLDYFAPVMEQGNGVIQDNRIDQIKLQKGSVSQILTRQDFESLIISQSNNNAPQVNKYPKAIKAEIGKALSVKFDADTIKDKDVYDQQLSYRLTLASKGIDGQYEPLPSWLQFDASTLTLTGTPSQHTNSGNTVQNYQFILWGTDSFGYSAGTYVNMTVSSVPTTNVSSIGTNFTVPTDQQETHDISLTLYKKHHLIGKNMAERMTGTASHEQLNGLNGNDILNGQGGNDILIGGQGNDTLIGGKGDDLYYFSSGFGKDTIINTGGGLDNIYFDGISYAQVSQGLVKYNNNLILKVKGTTDELTLKDFFLGGEHADIYLNFSGGGSISNQQLLQAFKSPKQALHESADDYEQALNISLSMYDGYKRMEQEGLSEIVVNIIG